MRLIRWILFLQKFDLEIRDKKGFENVVAYHLPRIIVEHIKGNDGAMDRFLDEKLLTLSTNTSL